MTTKEIKLLIIQNFIEYYTRDEDERMDMIGVAQDYVDEIEQSDYIKKGNKQFVNVVNNDPFVGEVIEEGCEIVEVLRKGKMTVKLGSDPSIMCVVEFISNRWEIVEDVY